MRSSSPSWCIPVRIMDVIWVVRLEKVEHAPILSLRVRERVPKELSCLRMGAHRPVLRQIDAMMLHIERS
jgi:hypothetical protein